MNNNVNAIIEGLNDEQRCAVECVSGAVLIVAGAGSGKTRVLTSRIANILSQGCDAGRILALTFTKKAAGEMKERIALMVGAANARKLQMGTFHSVFIRFLREYAQSIGYPENFTIYDTSDSVSAMKACIKELQLDDKVYKPKDVLSRISMAKNNLYTAAAYKADQNIVMNDTRSRKPRICDLYLLYDRKCKASGVMDFDDILMNMNILLRDHPEALRSISARFSYIMVDEYQDTNRAQYLILKKLAGPHGNICVVGDDSQSIYAFRGAKIENILNFKKDYPDCKVFRLERNYRSTATIVDAANSLIAKNENRIPKNCYSVAGKGEAIRLVNAYTDQEEAVMITSAILERMREESAQYQDFAILYRTNSQSRVLEDSLRKRNIPYMIWSGNSFFDRAEVKDMMAYMKLVVNPHDDESFKRIVNKPARGIGDTSLEALARCAREEEVSLFKAVYSENLATYGLKPAGIQKLRDFGRMIDALASKTRSVSAEVLATDIAKESGLLAFFKADTSIEGQSRASNIEELMNSVYQLVEDRQNEFLAEIEAEGGDPQTAEIPVVTLCDYLESTALLSSVDVDEEDSANKVALMTVHSSKGLEFPYVFIAGMEENLFPSSSVNMNPSELEEERRLFYVALTRAKKTVCLTFAQNRMRNGKTEYNNPSRFIREIDSKYIANPLPDEGNRRLFSESPSSYGRSSQVTYVKSSASRYQTQTQTQTQAPAPVRTAAPVRTPAADRYDASTFIPDSPAAFAIGQKVEHIKFGPGRIVDMNGSAPDSIKVKVVFEEYPEPKIILLKYAKMRIVK